MTTPFSHTLQSFNVDPPVHRLIFLAVSIVLICVWFFWFSFSRVTLYEVSEIARTQVSEAVYFLDAPVSGKVITVSTVLGQQVLRGDVLFEFDSTREKLLLKETIEKYYGVTKEIDSIKMEIAVAHKVGGFVTVSANIGMDEANAIYEKAQAQFLFADQRLRRFEKMYNRKQVSDIEILNIRLTAKEHEANSKSLKLALKRIEQGGITEISDREASLQRLRTKLFQRINNRLLFKSEIEKLNYDLNLNKVTSPITGRIGNLPIVHPGTYVKEGEMLARIVPESEVKVVAFFKPAAAVGRIKTGHIGRLLFKGFPWVQYGSVGATVLNVGNEERNGLIEVELAVNLSTGSIIPIQHGMPTTVEIEIEQMTPVELLLRSAGQLLQNQTVKTREWNDGK